MPATPTARRNWLMTALPAITFILGAVIGGVVIGVGFDSDDSAPSAQAGAGAGTPTDTSSATGPDTAVGVPAACSQAADAVSRAISLIRRGAADVRDFQPRKLTQVLDKLERLDPLLRDLARQCSKVKVMPTSAGATPTP